MPSADKGASLKGRPKNKPAETKRPSSDEKSWTVRECLTWVTYGNSRKGTPTKAKRPVSSSGLSAQNGHEPQPAFTRYLPKKAEIGKARSYGYEYPEPSVNSSRKPADDGKVIDALRGWPHLYRRPHSRSLGSAQDGAHIDANAKKTDEGYDSDATNMPDLMAHQYIFDKRNKKKTTSRPPSRGDSARSGRLSSARIDDNTGCKDTRAMPLREENRANVLQKNQRGGWKMSKFTKRAKPHISTFWKTEGCDVGVQVPTTVPGDRSKEVETNENKDQSRPPTRTSQKSGTDCIRDTKE